ncbi:hypothetical protein WDU94_007900 [Cyamophila willieti]
MKLEIILVILLGVKFSNEVVTSNAVQLGSQIVKSMNPSNLQYLYRWANNKGIGLNVTNFNEELDNNDPQIHFIPDENLNKHTGKHENKIPSKKRPTKENTTMGNRTQEVSGKPMLVVEKSSLHRRHIRDIFANRENGQGKNETVEDESKEDLKKNIDNLTVTDTIDSETRNVTTAKTEAKLNETLVITMERQDPVKPLLHRKEYRDDVASETNDDEELDVQINVTVVLFFACCLCCIINIIFCLALCFRID